MLPVHEILCFSLLDFAAILYPTARLFKTLPNTADFGLPEPSSRAGFRDFAEFAAHSPISKQKVALASDRYR